MIKKEEIIEYLNNIGIYETVDEYLVDQFIYNLEMIEQAKETLLTTGIVINIARPENNPYFQQSPAISVLNSATKNVLSISRKLALSPLDRANLKIEIAEEDGF